MQSTHNHSLSEEKRKIGTWGYLNKSRLAAILKYAGKQVLDVGCSTGSYVRYLCELGYDAYGFDCLDDERWQNEHKSRFLVADVSHLPFKNATFDTILCFEVLEHLEDVDLALEELHRVCRSNIIISVPNCFQPEVFQKSGVAYHHWIDRTHKQEFKEVSLRAQLEKHQFKVDVVKYINQIFPEILFLASWHLPLKVCEFIAGGLNKIPFRKKYFMTILVVASKGKR